MWTQNPWTEHVRVYETCFTISSYESEMTKESSLKYVLFQKNDNAAIAILQ